MELKEKYTNFIRTMRTERLKGVDPIEPHWEKVQELLKKDEMGESETKPEKWFDLIWYSCPSLPSLGHLYPVPDLGVFWRCKCDHASLPSVSDIAEGGRDCFRLRSSRTPSVGGGWLVSSRLILICQITKLGLKGEAKTDRVLPNDPFVAEFGIAQRNRQIFP